MTDFTWEIEDEPYGSKTVQELLKLGWEPFSVTHGTKGVVLWFRRKVSRETEKVTVTGIDPSCDPGAVQVRD